MWENPPLAFSTTQRGVCPTNFPNNRTCRRLFDLYEPPIGARTAMSARIKSKELADKAVRAPVRRRGVS